MKWIDRQREAAAARKRQASADADAKLAMELMTDEEREVIEREAILRAKQRVTPEQLGRKVRPFGE